MAHKYIAFLGTNSYLECDYTYQEQAVRCCFVQEALTSLFCRHWQPDDVILIFTTQAAADVNWRKLDERLMALNLPCPHRNVLIPEGNSEASLWEIFDVVFQQLGQQDEILFDVTHAFRSLPMLALIILNYAKCLKQCTLSGIYYGAFETLGPVFKVKDLPPEARRAPIFDLTPFVSVLDWTVGIDRFLMTGNADLVSTLTRQQIPQILARSNGQEREHARNVKAMARATLEFAQNSAACRGRGIVESALKVRDSLEAALHSSDAFVKPLKPLLDMMQTRFEVFEQQQDTANMFHAVRWCQKHHLIQQGLTLLQEGIVTHLCQQLGMEGVTYVERHAVTRAINVMLRQQTEITEIHYGANGLLLVADVKRCLPQPPDRFLKAFEYLRSARNNINHASSKKEAGYFRRALDEVLHIMEQDVLQHRL